jgi:hypothetical protein
MKTNDTFIDHDLNVSNENTMNNKTTSKIKKVLWKIKMSIKYWYLPICRNAYFEGFNKGREQAIKEERERLLKEIEEIKCVDRKHKHEFELAKFAIIGILTHTSLKGTK